jgi:hypothetical protein
VLSSLLFSEGMGGGRGGELAIKATMSMAWCAAAVTACDACGPLFLKAASRDARCED